MLAQRRRSGAPAAGIRPARVLRPLLAGVVAVAILAPGTAAEAAPSIGSIEAQITSQSQKLEKVVEQYDKLGEQLKASQAAAAALTNRLKPLQSQLDVANQQLDQMAVDAYKGSALAEATAVLSAPDTSTVVDRLVTLAQIGRYENAEYNRIALTKGAYDVAQAKLTALIAEQTAQRKALTDQKKQINAALAKLYALRTKAYGTAVHSSGSGAGTPPPYVAGKAGMAVDFAYKQLGKPYSWGAAGPNSYDCSGLTMASWKAAGVSLPHNAEMQYNALPHIKRSALQPGDLVFYDSLGHVAMFVGNGQVIHAPTFGDVVRLASIDMMTPYGYARPT